MDTDYIREYKKWLESPFVDEKTKKELRSLSENEEALKERFGSSLSFGTAGLRGVLGAGTNMMNIYTVRRATAGLARYIFAYGDEACAKGVAVAYDSRIMSREFSQNVCEVLTAYGIKVYLFDELRPTPELSFAIRELGCISGVNITASHNPKQYNGYKVYWDDGAQIGPEQASAVSELIEATDIFTGAKILSSEEAMKHVTILGSDFDEKYISAVLAQIKDPCVIKEHSDMEIIYTPFHGAGYRIVPDVLGRAGFCNVNPVKEQMVLDGNFPTVVSPNPENREGFAIAIAMAERSGAALIVGTDPDCDRMGVVVKNKDGQFIALSGNQTGVILLDYIIMSLKRNNKLPFDACAVKTIVSSEMAARVCEKNGVEIFNVLTGFKYIGGMIERFKETGHGTFIFGYEESYGYLTGEYARDKDGAVASLLICEAAAYYAGLGMTLADAMEALYKKYGYHTEKTVNIYMEGFDGPDKMKSLMNTLRSEKRTEIGELRVTQVKDYLTGIDGLPSSDVLYYMLEDKSVVVIRPSGTEPKIKIYIMTAAETKEESVKKNEMLEKAFRLICAV